MPVPKSIRGCCWRTKDLDQEFEYSRAQVPNFTESCGAPCQGTLVRKRQASLKFPPRASTLLRGGSTPKVLEPRGQEYHLLPGLSQLRFCLPMLWASEEEEEEKEKEEKEEE